MLSENILSKKLIPIYSDEVSKLAKETFKKLDGFYRQRLIVSFNKIRRTNLKTGNY
jgi:hypothetical protein